MWNTVKLKTTRWRQYFVLAWAISVTILAMPGVSASSSAHLLSRSRRAVKSVEVFENAAVGATLYDLNSQDDAKPLSSYSFQVVNATGVSTAIFGINDNKLKLISAPQAELDKFDRETFPMIVVNIEATRLVNPTVGQKVLITLELTLKDVNDENPVITNPKPYQATVAVNTGAGINIYTVTATDADQSPSLHFSLEQDSSPGFEITNTGGNTANIVTTSTNGYSASSSPLRVVVSVEDRASNPLQKISATVLVTVGTLPPQFFMTSYEGQVYENSAQKIVQMKDEDVNLLIQVKQFQTNNALSFSVDNNNFEIIPDAVERNRISLRCKEAYDYETTKSVNFRVTAKESGTNYQSTAQVTVFVIDENDSGPTFLGKSQYVVEVDEDEPIGFEVFQVTASDADSGTNGKITFSIVGTDAFEIETVPSLPYYTGRVRVKSPNELDYEKLEGNSNRAIDFSIIATDGNSVAPKSSSVMARVTVNNVNDNEPAIDNSSLRITVRSSAKQGEIVSILGASDVDGDNIEFSFQGSQTSGSGYFTLEKESGKLTLARDLPNNMDTFTLNVVTSDDGSCCREGINRRSTSTTEVTVTVEGANNYKPDFVNCNDYNKFGVEEKAPVGTSVGQVSAMDTDRGENGKVTYKLQSNRNPNPLTIDPDSGLITVLNKDEIVRKRGMDPYIQVTVIGENLVPSQELRGYCTFRVNIIDINDHPPRFDQAAYTVSFLLSTDLPAIITRMQATDEDFGENANITYSLGNTAPNFFSINRLSGYVTLEKNNIIQQQVYSFAVIANDNGNVQPLTATTTLNVEVTQGTFILPIWTTKPSGTNPVLQVSEDTVVNTVLTKLGCKSGSPDNPRVEFRVFDTQKSINDDSEYFTAVTLNPGSDSDPDAYTLEIRLKKQLDFLVQKEHTVTATCQGFDSGTLRAPDIFFRVQVLDSNNQRPLLEGMDSSSGRYFASVPEESPLGTSVRRVKVNDKDENPLFKQITFSLADQDYQFFTISKVGDFEAQVNTAEKFDRETKNEYIFKIIASDGVTRADDRFMVVTVTDVNDMEPSFPYTRYEFNVSETAEINSPIGEVTATDKDLIDINNLDYQFTGGNTNSVFSILSGTGQIRLSRKVDFDDPNQPKTYNLQLTAYDNGRVHSATTSVTIRVLDENDNSPQFTQNLYVVDNLVTEEEERDTALYLTTVQAFDKDTQRVQTKITYRLAAPSALFRVNATSGDVYLIGKLDRESPSDNIVTIIAEDEPIDPLLAYTDVKVNPIDINDNKPVFDTNHINFEVDEHSPLGKFVGFVLANDKDEGDNSKVEYRFADPNQPRTNYFNLESNSGKLSTNVEPSLLDYENFTSVQLVVEAYDLGQPRQSSLQTITISLIDKNDQKPYFEKNLYTESMSEATTSGRVLSVLAKDDDTDPRNRAFQFSLEPNSKHFLIDSSGDYGVITVNPDNPIDYERDPHKYNFTLRVSDGGPPDHTATTQVVITVLDSNDNKPIFDPKLVSKTLTEGDPKGAYIATFKATDADSGINAEIEYSIQQDSDPFFEFYIDPVSGNVTTRKVLDRELADTRRIFILATDKGDPAQSGSAILSLSLIDINDNAPMFAENYQPIVPENEDNNNRVVVEIFAQDPDTRVYGPPFGFALPQGCTVPACAEFSLQYNSGAAGGNGSATIRTSTNFDREARKEYFLPIVMWDMNNGQNNPESQTATNTLTIVIGDKNDNKHSPGHQEITFNNFDGKFGDVEIGRVYAEDADDWDLPDKTFTYVSPEIYKNYFSVDGESGKITIKKGVPATQNNEPYKFEVDVYDKAFKNTETCTVAVTVKDLPDEALKKAGSVRLTGISSEEFIAAGGPSKPGIEPPPSKMQKFRAEVARLLQYPGPDNIEIVGLIDGPNYLDVRFSGHASPYVTASQMESTVMLNAKSIEDAAGIKIGQVPINLCMEEKFSIGCYVDEVASAEPLVIDANGTSLTTVKLASQAKDGCPSKEFPEPVVCSGDYCFNGGTCVQDDWSKLSCRCLPGFDGQRCQQRRHSFDGNSIAFYKGLSPCTQGRTSIEFITLEPDGLIMFSGPVIDIDPNNSPQDFMTLELKNGYPHFRLNLGVGEVALSLDGLNEQSDVKMPALNDGQWHRIDIDRDFQDVTLTVDHCKYATADANGTVTDWTPCLTQGRVPGGDVLLNVQSLLQLGGRYPRTSPPSFPTGVPTKGFKGCLKNLFHNSILYDLYYKPILNWNSGTNGCPTEERICRENDPVPFCGVQASCQSSWNGEVVEACTCNPGWRGAKCDQAAPVMDLGSKSFLQWELSSNQIQDAERMASFQLMFRSREHNGSLFAMTNAAQNQIDLELLNGHLRLRYNLGQGEHHLALDKATASDGAWHEARVERFGSELQLTLDAGEGRTYNYMQIDEDVDVLFKALPYISAGGRVPTMASPSVDQISKDLVKTCVRDIRFNGQWLPMTQAQNSEAGPGIKLLSAPNVAEGCTRNDCYQVDCTDGRFCYPLWGAYECRCLAGTRLDASGVCVSACDPNPCFNNVPCSIVDNNVKCQCPPDFTGQFCNIGLVSEDEDDTPVAAIVGSVLAVLLILILVALIFLYITCRRKNDNEKNILEVDPDDDFIRENVMYYDEEGAGEEDHEAYDITLLQKMNSETLNRPYMNAPKEDEMTRRNEPRLDRPDVGSFIDSRIRDTENDDDPFKDVPMEFNYEGGNSDAGSLSSLNTSSSGGSQDYDYLNEWGPKFARLADMYGAGQNLES